MKKIKLYVFGFLTLLLLLASSVYAQQGVRSRRFTIAGPDSAINLINTSITWHQLTWVVSGSVSGCTIALDTSSNGSSWTPGGAIAGQSCTSNGSSSIVNISSNYVRMNMTAFTATGGGSVTVTWDGWTSNPNKTTMDCSSSIGADLGAKWNACAASAPPGATISLANFPSPQTQTTPVVVTNNVDTFCGGLTINQQASITIGDSTYTTLGASLSGSPTQLCNLVKAANIDQVTLVGGNNTLSNVNMNGARGSAFTGSGLIISSTASNSTLSNTTITSEASFDIQDQGSFEPSLRNVSLQDYGDTGLRLDGTSNLTSQNLIIGDASDSIGPGIDLVGGLFNNFSLLNLSTSGAVAGITNTGKMTISQSTLIQSGGFPAYLGTGGTLILSSSLAAITGSTSHGPAIESDNGTLILVDNYQVSADFPAGGNVIQASGDVIIKNNFFQFILGTGAGNCGICLGGVGTNLIGAVVTGNDFDFGVSSTPSGANYAIHMIVPLSGHMINNQITENTFSGANLASVVGVFFDNTATGLTANFNVIGENKCIDFSGSGAACIKRTDSINNSNFYRNNVTNLGSSQLYASGGSTNDVITQTISPFTFATLPTMGNGSQVYCSDCTQAKPTAGSGGGAMVVRAAGQNNGI